MDFKNLFSAFTPKAPTTVKGGDITILNSLVQEFSDRSRADIKKWRDAIQAAEDPETPNWAPLQDLYENLQTDGHLQGVLIARLAAVTAGRFYIRNEKGEEQEDKTKLLRTEWFYSILYDMLNAPYYAYSVLELVDPATFKFELLPRRNCLPQWNYIKLESGEIQKGAYYDAPEYDTRIINVRSKERYGAFNNIVPQLIWKRNAQQIWADFSERFGLPFVTSETTETDKRKLDLIENMMRKLGQAAQAIFPVGTTVKVHDNAKMGDPHRVFDKQIDRTNSEVSKAILGGTMVVDPGSSRSQSEVHERTLDEKVAEADRRMIEFTVNDQLLPILRAHGLPFADGETLEFDRTEDMTATEHWAIISSAIELYDIPDEWVSRRFNFPINGRKQQSQAQSPVQTKQPNASASFTANFK